MATIQDNITTATARVTEISQLIPQLEAEAAAHEQAAREKRLTMSNLKAERADLNRTLGHMQVIDATQQAANAAQQAKSQAETHLADAAKQREEAAAQKAAADELLARLADKEKQLDEKLAAQSSTTGSAKADQ